ncbi:MAG TPA: class I SAM-dependent methyltransferase [Anaerolineae bacterium]|nr:class I SAM-dependent methyltransferase [Anaerolineae bacterium]
MVCPLCDGNERHVVYAGRDMTAVQCCACGLVYQLQDATSHGALDAYYRNRPTQDRLKWDGSTRRLRDVIDDIRRSYPGGRLLDAGCGSGEFVQVMAEAGLECVGVEPNTVQAEYAQERGLHVINDVFRDGLFPPGSFDVVTLIQVMEHLLDPVGALRAARALLRPGGMVVIDVPGYNNPRFLLYRATHIKRFAARDFIRPHVLYLTPRTLAAIVEKSGLRVARWTCGRYVVKFGANPFFRLADRLARRFRIGGIVMYAVRSD